MNTRIVSAVGLALMCATASLAAAPAESPAPASGPEVFASVGTAQFLDDEGSLGRGWPVGVGLGYNWRRPFSVRLEVVRLAHERRDDGSDVRFDGTATLLAAGASYRFGRSPAEPYVFMSAGVLHSDRRSSFPTFTSGPVPGPPVPGPPEVFEGSDTEPVWGGGGGIDITAGHLLLRPEISLHVSVPSYFAIPKLTFAAGWRW